MDAVSWKPARTADPVRGQVLVRAFAVAAVVLIAYVAYDTVGTPHVGGVSGVAPGGSHTGELIGGGVRCWGANGEGELGDNSRTTRMIPVAVAGLAADVVAIAAGSFHTCALSRAGAVKCWGDNTRGQLGDGSLRSHSEPVAAFAIDSGASAIAAGGNHSCALVRGALRCWGSNSYGQLGGRQVDAQPLPSPAGLANSVTAIQAGIFHTCALTAAGWIRLGGTGLCGNRQGSNAG